MNFQKGDRVKFLNDVGGGIVQSADNKMALVLRDDGFEIPARVSELILVEKSQTQEFSRQVIEEEKVKVANSRAESASLEKVVNGQETVAELPESGRNPAFAVYYAIVPGKSNILGTEQYDFYLINDSEFILLFNMQEENEGYYRSLQFGKLEADTKLFIRSFSREELNEFPRLKLQCLFFRKGLHKSYSPLHRDITPEPAGLFSFSGFKVNDFFEEDAFVCPVVEETRKVEYEKNTVVDFESVKQEKEDKSPAVVPKKDPLPDIEEVDLHIHELVENYAGMSKGEIIEIQLARFHTALDGALKSKTKRIVFIHGVGNGKLKFEIRRELDKKYPRLKYQDASFREYGFGATMVILKK